MSTKNQKIVWPTYSQRCDFCQSYIEFDDFFNGPNGESFGVWCECSAGYGDTEASAIKGWHKSRQYLKNYFENNKEGGDKMTGKADVSETEWNKVTRKHRTVFRDKYGNPIKYHTGFFPGEKNLTINGKEKPSEP